MRYHHGEWREFLTAQTEKIPILPEVEAVSDRVIRVMAGNPGL
jgi:hypothetical protein